MLISKKRYDKMMGLIQDQDELILKQNRMLHQLHEENRQQAKLIGLYEACINKGIQVDFPDVTGKGGNTVQNGSKGFKGNNTDNIKY